MEQIESESRAESKRRDAEAEAEARRLEQQAEADARASQLGMLRYQLNPHFLFNTLHTIGQLWRSGRPDEADAMLDEILGKAVYHKI